MSEQKEPAFLRVRFYTTLPAVVLLLGVLAYGTASLLHGRLLQFGEHLWDGYHGLRADPELPECDVDSLRTRRDAVLTGAPAPANSGAGDSAGEEGTGEDGSGEDGAGEDGDVDLDELLDQATGGDAPPPATDPPADGEVDLDALLDQVDAPEPAQPEPAQPEPPAPAQPEPATPDPSADGARAPPADPLADGEVDLDALLAEVDPAPAEQPGEEAADAKPADAKPDAWYALDNLLTQCEAEHATYTDATARITPWVRRYRAVEGGVEALVRFGVDSLSQMLALLLLICGLATTFFKHHIALRPARSKLDHRVSDVAQLVANLLLLYSSWVFKSVDNDAFGDPQHALLHWIWIGGFTVICLANVYTLLRPPPGALPGGSFLRATLSIPLYAMMALISGSYFLIAEAHPAGLAIYLAKLTEHALLYLNVGLYVWVGMLLKRTKLATLCFDALRPWKLAPELLAFVAVVGAALPTAYSGASGIFVIAVGAVIYRELRKAGARRQLSLAATAMSGSMGVVLSPCLLVVIVASLNQEVVTDQLYTWGNRVFLLSAVLFLVVALATRQGKLTVARPRQAMPGMLAALAQLLPYLVLFAVLLVGYRYTLDAGLDEHSAPIILPVLMIGVLLYDRLRRREVVSRTGRVIRFGFRRALGAATSETTGHIGALLFLMGLSICLGGIIERADVMSLVPESFGSLWTTMLVLVVALVIIGMTMDPYGAVVLVSATIAEVAYRNGVDPVHFWMVVLVAFELGYLTPPVALNHLLTRQVVGDPKVERADHEPGSFWARRERILLPIVVMGTALIIVAFGPMLFEGYGGG